MQQSHDVKVTYGILFPALYVGPTSVGADHLFYVLLEGSECPTEPFKLRGSPYNNRVITNYIFVWRVKPS